MTALVDTDIDEMWERYERATLKAEVIAEESGNSASAESSSTIHGRVNGSVDQNGNFVTRTTESDGTDTIKQAPLSRSKSYSNQMIRAMSQQLHESMDKYFMYDLNLTDSVFRARLDDRKIYPEFVAIEIVDRNDTPILRNGKLVKGTGGYDQFRLCFNPEKGWFYRAHVTPLTRHILSQMTGIIVTVFLLMITFAAAFWYLFRTVSRLRTIEEMKDDFVSNMTHELKTPISIAYSANDALLHYDTANDLEKKNIYLSIALKQLKKLGESVENILAVSMERRKSMTLKPEKIDLTTLTYEIAEAQRLRGEKEVGIDVESNGEVYIIADKGHLSNVLNNLIDNAIKYSGESVNIKIRIDADTLSISDNGIGIPAKALPYIFDKFYRVPHGNRQDIRGYGIGLYYVRNILQKMGFDINVKSREGLGSVFTIRMKMDYES